MNIKLLCIGNLGAGKTLLSEALAIELRIQHESIDRCRKEKSNGSSSGEAFAWYDFLCKAESKVPMVLECSGGGPFRNLLKLAIKSSAIPLLVVYVSAPVEECIKRVENRGLNVPYPDWGVSSEQVIKDVEKDLEALVSSGFWGEQIINVDGTKPIEENMKKITEIIKKVSK